MISVTVLLRRALRILAPLAILSTLYLYYYPIFLGCAFPLPESASSVGSLRNGSAAYLETIRQHVPFLQFLLLSSSISGDSANGHAARHPNTYRPTRRAPFRLLTFGDPQLEGDSSIPNAAKETAFPHFHMAWDRLLGRHGTSGRSNRLRERIRSALHHTVDLFLDDVPDTIESIRKRIDLRGNDLYLSLIYRTIRWWTKPTHVTVLGDLLGSQWIDDDEFDRRAHRFWDVVFSGAERVPDEFMVTDPGAAGETTVTGYLDEYDGENSKRWSRRLINVAGNHDIGYAGDFDSARLERFENKFGKANYEMRFALPVEEPEGRHRPELRLVVLNDMNLDTPVRSHELQVSTYEFVNKIITHAAPVEQQEHFTVLLTHIPLYKPAGVCVDAPFFSFFGEEWGGGIREQNQLSAEASRGLLEGLFGMSGDRSAPARGMGRPGVIINGHDHEGCDTWHFINQTTFLSHGQHAADVTSGTAASNDMQTAWEVKRWSQAVADGHYVGAAAGSVRPGLQNLVAPGIRELTVRSMMGDFGGNVGMLSAWFDEEAWEWRYSFDTCAVGTHNVWWLVHVLDLIVVIGLLLYPVVKLAEPRGWLNIFGPSQQQQRRSLRKVRFVHDGNSISKAARAGGHGVPPAVSPFPSLLLNDEAGFFDDPANATGYDSTLSSRNASPIDASLYLRGRRSALGRVMGRPRKSTW